MIYILMGILAVVGVQFLLPSKRGNAGRESQTALEVYKAQLAELEADMAAGRMTADAARDAKLEIERRILRAAQQEKRASEGASVQKDADVQKGVDVQKGTGALQAVGGQASANVPAAQTPAAPVVIASAAFILLVGGVFYSVFGSPHLPAEPGVQSRLADTPLGEGPLTYGEAVENIRARISQAPNDAQGHIMLARAAQLTRDYETVIGAFDSLTRLQPDEQNWYIQRFLAYLAEGRGQMTPAAQLAYKDMAARLPNAPVTRFYGAHLLKDAGKLSEAVAALKALQADVAGSSLEREIDRQIALWTDAPENAGTGSGPSQSELAATADAVNAMSPEEQRAFIGQMVGRLEARLEDNPQDAEGWVRLARAKFVLDGQEAARTVLEAALAQNPAGTYPNEFALLQAELDRLNASGNP